MYLKSLFVFILSCFFVYNVTAQSSVSTEYKKVDLKKLIQERIKSGTIKNHSQNRSPITINLSLTHLTCPFKNDGTATASVSGGIPPYKYIWYPSKDTTTSIDSLAPGYYSLMIIDSICDFDTVSFVINPTNLIFNGLSYSGATTCNMCDGYAILSTQIGPGPFTYLWSPGGQTTSSVSNLCGGTYTVTVTDLGKGCSQSATIEIIATVPQLGFTIDNLCFGDSASFTTYYLNIINPFMNNTCYSRSSWLWDFGDPLSSSNTSTLENPKHKFYAPGTYTVTLIVNNNDTVVNTVTIDSIHVDFMAFSDCNIPPTIYFEGNSTCADSWLWDFGEPSSSSNTDTIQYPIHTYAAPGIYNVQLIINNGSGAADTIVKTIHAVPPPSINIGNDTTLYIGDSLTLNAGNWGTYYSWSTGDTTSTIVVKENGYYSIAVFNELFCPSYSDIFVRFCGNSIPTSLVESANEFIAVYPNPTTGSFIINSSNKIQNIVITNIIGQGIYASESLSNKIELNLSSQPKGVYFYQIKTEGEKIKTGKIIIE